MQVRHIYHAGQVIFTQKEGNGKEKLFIDEVLDDGDYWQYRLRRGDTKGEGVLKNSFAETDLSEKASVR